MANAHQEPKPSSRYYLIVHNANKDFFGGWGYIDVGITLSVCLSIFQVSATLL